MMGARGRPRLAAAIVLASMLAAAQGVAVDAQCSMCRSLLATPEGERIAAGLRSGIWILLAAPFGAFAVIAVAALRSRKRIEALRVDRLPEKEERKTKKE